MNSQISFKGKTIDNNEWIEGYYVNMPERENHYELHFILSGKSDLFYGSGTCRETFDKKEVDPNTVCQYTGINDKNQNKIYFDHSIVKIQVEVKSNWLEFVYEIKAVFHFNQEELRTELDIYGHPQFTSLWFDFLKMKDMEIIGNIHDNPELIKR